MGDREALKRRLIDELFDMGIVHTDPILDRIIDVCQADAGAKGETVSREGALQSDRSAEAKQILRMERELKSLRLQVADLTEGNDERLMLARLKADATIEEMDRAALLQTIAKLEAKYRFADLDGCITSYLRAAAKETFAGNCTFADDDLNLLRVCAKWALENGIPDDLCPAIFPKAKAVLAANSQSQIEEAQRADTMPLTSGETPDTNNQDADNV